MILKEIVENFTHRLSLLDNSQLDLIDARLSLLLHKMCQVQERKSALSADQNGKVGFLRQTCVFAYPNRQRSTSCSKRWPSGTRSAAACPTFSADCKP